MRDTAAMHVAHAGPEPRATGERFAWREWLAPRHWPTWSGLGALWLLTRLPLSAVLAIGRTLGPIVIASIPKRARAVAANLEIAFPELDAAGRAALARASARHTGMSVMELAWLWCRPANDIRPRFRFEGEAHVEAALARGKGVILLQAHFTLLDFAGAAVAQRWPATGLYDPPKNPLFAALQVWHRERFATPTIPNHRVREMVSRLRRGEMIWFLPDQAVSERRGGIPSRYFGRPVLASGGTARIVAMTGAALIPMVPVRSHDGRRYTVRFGAPMTLDTGDVDAATQRINDLFEAQVRERPEQYLWGHRRFKPPTGEASPYA